VFGFFPFGCQCMRLVEVCPSSVVRGTSSSCVSSVRGAAGGGRGVGASTAYKRFLRNREKECHQWSKARVVCSREFSK